MPEHATIVRIPAHARSSDARSRRSAKKYEHPVSFSQKYVLPRRTSARTG